MMSFKKNLLASLLGISLSSISMFAHANLYIQNNTSQFSTAIINKGICSSNSALGESGITKPHSSNTVTDFVLWFACHATPNNCRADIYMTKNCNLTGAKSVATIYFDTTTGIKLPITTYSNEYTFTGAGFAIQIDGGPAFDLENEFNSIW